ncbi:hypothetical protein KVH24_32045 [Streptomyces olivaceus]|uniref:hypothetical protein n=1 Tax=Streptomyces olivaceus TaxID=47716 RepID=UPI001CC94F5B|nr:hypothetical protein [Streptomyces olivaceus]MBZ6173220.1 hypothetical protein [Streptomyces olivaceus]MBZ6183588.1 hypothetical protein [Streptomyces olivaceus]
MSESDPVPRGCPGDVERAADVLGSPDGDPRRHLGLTVLRRASGPGPAGAVTAVRLGTAGTAEGLDDDGVAAAHRWTY